MPDCAGSSSAASPPRPPAHTPLVVSLCGTYLKKEMQSIYRQLTGLRRYRTVVLTERLENEHLFPFDPVIQMTRPPKPRPRGNFVLRFWYKHVVKQWPPPRPITSTPPHYPFNLIELLREHRPALVHVYYGHKAVRYLDMLEVWGGPFVVSFHGVDVVKFADDPTYVAKLQRVFEKARLVMARSHSLQERLKELGCPPAKLRLNRTPVPLNQIPFSEKTPPTDGAWQLLQACRLIPKKGLVTALEALALVVPRFPRVHFTIAGTGPDEAALREKIRTLGLEQHTTLTGWCSQAELAALQQRSHLFLHPSEMTLEGDQEGVPNSMLEAMAAGLPVVATRHGGIPEAVTHEKDGLLVEEKNVSALAEALLRLMENPELLRTYSRQAAASVRAAFSAESALTALEDCYTEALATR